MKNAISKSSLLAFGLLLLLFSGFTSCKKDKDEAPKPLTIREQFVGKWEIKSFTIDGVEAKGSVITSSKMEFEAYSGSNGDFKWSINYIDGTSEIQSGDYTVDEKGKEITLENDEGSHFTLAFDLDGDDLMLSGIEDGQHIVIITERD
ncbi:MAG: lipocalin family protein [Saprospiraceae bacterium]